MSVPPIGLGTPSRVPENQEPLRKKQKPEAEAQAETKELYTTSSPGKQLEIQKQQSQQAMVSATHSKDQVVKSADKCLEDLDQINCDKIEAFANCLFEEAGAVRTSGSKEKVDQKAESDFCDNVTTGILEITSKKAIEIANSSLTADAKAQKMENLKNLSAGLCQLVSVQRRFGGSAGGWLAFHNIHHSAAVAVKSARDYEGSPATQFAAFNAGAAHDSVMRFEAAPNLAIMDAIGLTTRNTFFALFDARFPLEYERRELLENPSEAGKKRIQEIDSELEKTKDKWFAAVKGCYMKGEQKRIAGTETRITVKNDVRVEESCSEQDSAIQFTNYNKEIGAICASVLEKDAAAALSRFNSLSASDNEFGVKTIYRTVPSKANFFFPGGGHKCYTVANFPLIPDPDGLWKLSQENPELAERLCKLLDSVMAKAIRASKVTPEIPPKTEGVTESGTYSYSDAVKDIETFKKDPLAEKGKFFLPSFMRDKGNGAFFSAAMPPFNDPIAPFINLVASGKAIGLLEAFETALVEALQQDKKEAKEKGVIPVASYLKERESLMGTPSADLSAYVNKGAKKDWVEETDALLDEEQAATKRKFIMHDEHIKTLDIQGKQFPNGLRDPALHVILDKAYANFLVKKSQGMELEKARSEFLQEASISVTDYQDIQLFIEVKKHYPRDQVPFGRGKLTYDEFRNNAPLSALSKALEDQVTVANHLAGYRGTNCVKNRLRQDGVKGIEEYDAACTANGKAYAVSTFYEHMERRAGAGFMNNPESFVLVGDDGKPKEQFLKDQNNLTIRSAKTAAP